MQLKNVGKIIWNQAILEDIQLNISPSKFTAFIGPNGAGENPTLLLWAVYSRKDRGFLSIKEKKLKRGTQKSSPKELTIFKTKSIAI